MLSTEQMGASKAGEEEDEEEVEEHTGSHGDLAKTKLSGGGSGQESVLDQHKKEGIGSVSSPKCRRKTRSPHLPS